MNCDSCAGCVEPTDLHDTAQLGIEFSERHHHCQSLPQRRQRRRTKRIANETLFDNLLEDLGEVTSTDDFHYD